MDKKELAELIDARYREHRQKETVLLADRLRTLGFTYATQAGISICIDDMVDPGAKKVLLDEAQKEVERDRGAVHRGSHHRRRALQQGRRHLGQVADAIAERDDERRSATRRVDGPGDAAKKRSSRRFNPIYIMADSGARGSHAADPAAGRHARPDGQAVGRDHRDADHRELPRGSPVLQYFISTHGARKGLADTALKTANSGYLTRRLVDVAQDAIITEFDCGTLDGIEIERARARAARSSSRSATASSAASCSRTSSTRSPARCSSRPTTELDEAHGQAASRTPASTRS